MENPFNLDNLKVSTVPIDSALIVIEIWKDLLQNKVTKMTMPILHFKDSENSKEDFLIMLLSEKVNTDFKVDIIFTTFHLEVLKDVVAHLNKVYNEDVDNMITKSGAIIADGLMDLNSAILLIEKQAKEFVLQEGMADEGTFFIK